MAADWTGLSLEERRQANRDAVARARCERCERPTAGCYCAFLSRIDTETRIVLLQHPREEDVAIGTARMASLCLANSELHVLTHIDERSALAHTIQDPARPAILLYPGEEARDIVAEPPQGPVTLVVVDGTWSLTKKLVKLNPMLQKLPRYAFAPPRPSEYRIRKEPAENCVATIEALVHVLTALEGDGPRFDQLMRPFRAMIDFQIACEQRLDGARKRKPKNPKPLIAPGVPTVLRDHLEKIVCVVAEANSWAYADRARDPAYADELVQWVAHRPFTGETFATLAAPKRGLSPNTLRHTEIDAGALAKAGSLEELHAAWRAWVRDDDLVCSWGRFETSLFTETGGFLPMARVDLRQVARAVERGKVGTLEEYLGNVARGGGPPLTEGRAGRKLRAVVDVTRHFAPKKTVESAD